MIEGGRCSEIETGPAHAESFHPTNTLQNSKLPESRPEDALVKFVKLCFLLMSSLTQLPTT